MLRLQRKSTLGVLDPLRSVVEDVNPNKGVLVSSNGCSSTALKKQND